jgi:hypothetical protein
MTQHATKPTTQDHQPINTTCPPVPAKTTSPTIHHKIKKTKNEEQHTHASRSDGPPAAGRTHAQS